MEWNKLEQVNFIMEGREREREREKEEYVNLNKELSQGFFLCSFFDALFLLANIVQIVFNFLLQWSPEFPSKVEKRKKERK